MCVITAGVHAKTLGRITEVSKCFSNRFTSLPEKMCRHYNAAAHHLFKGQHHFTGIDLKYFCNKTFIGFCMTGFIGCNNTTDLRELVTAMFFGQRSSATMRNICGQFLERSVYKIFVRISCSSIIHSICRSEEHTSELQSQSNLVCRLLLE